MLVVLGIFAVQSHVHDSAALAGLARTRLELEQQLGKLDEVGWKRVITTRATTNRGEPDAAGSGAVGSAAAALHRLQRDSAIARSAARTQPPAPPPLAAVSRAVLTSLVPLRNERDFECPGLDEMRSSGGCQIACRSGSDCARAVAACGSLAAPPESCLRVAVNAERTWATLKREGPVRSALRAGGGPSGGGEPGRKPDAVFLSTDFHIATIADVKWTFRDMCRSRERRAAAPHAPPPSLCAHVIDHSFSGACGLTAGGRAPTCAAPHIMHPLEASNGLTLCPDPYALRASFFEKFKHAGRCVDGDSPATRQRLAVARRALGVTSVPMAIRGVSLTYPLSLSLSLRPHAAASTPSTPSSACTPRRCASFTWPLTSPSSSTPP